MPETFTFFTGAEMEAYNLVARGRPLWSGENVRFETDKACDYIIALAERIKSSRSAATMQFAATAAHYANKRQSNETRSQGNDC